MERPVGRDARVQRAGKRKAWANRGGEERLHIGNFEVGGIEARMKHRVRVEFRLMAGRGIECANDTDPRIAAHELPVLDGDLGWGVTARGQDRIEMQKLLRFGAAGSGRHLHGKLRGLHSARNVGPGERAGPDAMKIGLAIQSDRQRGSAGFAVALHAEAAQLGIEFAEIARVEIDGERRGARDGISAQRAMRFEIARRQVKLELINASVRGDCVCLRRTADFRITLQCVWNRWRFSTSWHECRTNVGGTTSRINGNRRTRCLYAQYRMVNDHFGRAHRDCLYYC